MASLGLRHKKTPFQVRLKSRVASSIDCKRKGRVETTKSTFRTTTPQTSSYPLARINEQENENDNSNHIYRHKTNTGFNNMSRRYSKKPTTAGSGSEYESDEVSSSASESSSESDSESDSGSEDSDIEDKRWINNWPGEGVLKERRHGNQNDSAEMKTLTEKEKRRLSDIDGSDLRR